MPSVLDALTAFLNRAEGRRSYEEKKELHYLQLLKITISKKLLLFNNRLSVYPLMPCIIKNAL